MKRSEKCRVIYDTSYEFLKKIAQAADLTDEQLEEYLTPAHMIRWFRDLGLDFTDENDMRFIMCRLVASLSNRTVVSNVINFRSNFTKMKTDLYDFEPEMIVKHAESIRVKDAEGTIRPGFSRGVIEAANALNGINGKEFRADANTFLNGYTKKEHNSMRKLFKNNIYGFGETLISDFLKEIGFDCLGKPDKHINDLLFGNSSTCMSRSKTYRDVQNSISEIADAVGVKPYRVDKIIWLACAKNKDKFYLENDDKHLVHKANKNKEELYLKLETALSAN